MEELKLTKESICVNEIIFDGALEQPVELDYLLPDYCPSIFKVLKCKVTPKITTERVLNGKILIDGIVCIKIIYVSEENYKLRSILQKQSFSKSMDLKDSAENAAVLTQAKCDYVNCRAVDPRRLDIHGAISIHASVSTMKKIDVLSNVSGMGMQVHNQQITALEKRLFASKEFIIKEDLELPYGKPSVFEILNNTAHASLTDYKVIANKVVVKGEIQLHTLYLGEKPSNSPEIMDYTVPLSQVVDVSGINESFQCSIQFDVTNIELEMVQNGDGENKSFHAEFGLRVSCEADKNAQTQLINDLFSTGYPIQPNISKIKIEQLLCTINETRSCKNTVKLSKEEINCVYDISCDFCDEGSKYQDKCVNISGNLNVGILALDCDNIPTLIEKTFPCELSLNAECASENKDVLFHPFITIAGVSYSLVSGNEVEVRADIRICGNLYQYCYYNVVNAVEVDEKNPKERSSDAVLRLYFASCGEQVWDIAKHFNTSVGAIMEENNLEKEKLTEPEMLLIPILN